MFSRAGAALVDWIPVGEDPDEEDERLTELLDPIGMPQVKVFHVNFGTNCNFWFGFFSVAQQTAKRLVAGPSEK